MLSNATANDLIDALSKGARRLGIDQDWRTSLPPADKVRPCPRTGVLSDDSLYGYPLSAPLRRFTTLTPEEYAALYEQVLDWLFSPVSRRLPMPSVLKKTREKLELSPADGEYLFSRQTVTTQPGREEIKTLGRFVLVGAWSFSLPLTVTGKTFKAGNFGIDDSYLMTDDRKLRRVRVMPGCRLKTIVNEPSTANPNPDGVTDIDALYKMTTPLVRRKEFSDEFFHPSSFQEGLCIAKHHLSHEQTKWLLDALWTPATE